MSQASCFNCQHLKTWWHSATYWEPEDSGWECSKGLDEVDFDNDPESDDQQAEWLASQCSSYEYFDWDEYHRAQAEAEAKMQQYEKDYEKYLTNLYNPIPGDK